MLDPQHSYIGSLNNGVYNLGWEFPITVPDDTTPVIISYQIVNNGASDQHQQIQNDAAILGHIGNIISAAGAATGPIDPIGGAVVGVIGATVGAIGNAVQAIDGLINCDKMVVNDVFLTTGATMRAALANRLSNHYKRLPYPWPIRWTTVSTLSDRSLCREFLDYAKLRAD
jgi:hypothetical protein